MHKLGWSDVNEPRDTCLLLYGRVHIFDERKATKRRGRRKEWLVHDPSHTLYLSLFVPTNYFNPVS